MTDKNLTAIIAMAVKEALKAMAIPTVSNKTTGAVFGHKSAVRHSYEYVDETTGRPVKASEVFAMAKSAGLTKDNKTFARGDYYPLRKDAYTKGMARERISGHVIRCTKID